MQRLEQLLQSFSLEGCALEPERRSTPKHWQQSEAFWDFSAMMLELLCVLQLFWYELRRQTPHLQNDR
jgi:hypothetical protein